MLWLFLVIMWEGGDIPVNCAAVQLLLFGPQNGNEIGHKFCVPISTSFEYMYVQFLEQGLSISINQINFTLNLKVERYDIFLIKWCLGHLVVSSKGIHGCMICICILPISFILELKLMWYQCLQFSKKFQIPSLIAGCIFGSCLN